MPAADNTSIDEHEILATDQPPRRLPFPPVTRQHILNCSYHSWWPRYRSIIPKSRLIPLNDASVAYLRADGIVLPDDSHDGIAAEEQDDDSGFYSLNNDTGSQQDGWDDADEEEDSVDVTVGWKHVHQLIRDTIDELGGAVMPKLNWSAPKDATWINANTMECRTAQDVYLLMKSSDFVTHDLEHAFDGTEDSNEHSFEQRQPPYHLVLRKHVPQWNPSMEFRCFVRQRRLLAMCQRDLNHFDFLAQMVPHLRSRIQEFFDERLRDTFPDENFAFDVYVPNGGDRVWLVDINPWASRTDPLLFSWLELLEMDEPPPDYPHNDEEVVSLPLRMVSEQHGAHDSGLGGVLSPARRSDAVETAMLRPGANDDEDDDDDEDEDADEMIWHPELRLVLKTDPEAYSFNTPQYSAHKLPKDVVDASQSGEGLRQFAQDWKNILEKRQRLDAEAGDGDESVA